MRALFLALAFLTAPIAHAELELQTLPRDIAFERMLAGLNLETQQCSFPYKTTGTSLGFKIERGGEKIGKWLPRNEGTDVEAQVVSYRLGRYFRMGELVVPSAYLTVRGRALAQFRHTLSTRFEKYLIRQKNQANLLAALQRNPYEMTGVLAAPTDEFEVKSLVNASQNIINRAHPIAGYIQADGPMPSAHREMSFPEKKLKNGTRPTNTELELAREFSQIMVLDILTGQWDRWSGGNVEAVFRADRSGTIRVHFIARDNGGAGMAGTANMKKTFTIVSRFDRNQIRLVSQLAGELRRDSEGVKRSLGMSSRAKSLILRVDAVLARVRELESSYGAGRVYFPD